MSATRNERLAASFDGTFVVFMIGMRVNSVLKIHKWLPVATAMPRMVRELYAHPELGFVHAEAWFGRTTIMVQYWRSIEQLLAYSRNKDAAHLPAWRDFNRAAGRDGSGIASRRKAVTPFRSVRAVTVYTSLVGFVPSARSE